MSAMLNVLLYYKYVQVPSPEEEMAEHRKKCLELGLTGRIIISKEGINGTCAGSPENIERYTQWMNAHPVFHSIHFKESESEHSAFKKLSIRVRDELVTLRHTVDVSQAAEYITPEELHAALTNNEEIILVDMRNDYEADIGRFQNAVVLPIRYFRDLPEYLPHLEHLKHLPVVTYCTGGIRCEKASALLREHGFTHVRQLEGGIVTYAEKFPNGFFQGTCFVFDARMSLRYSDAGTLGRCRHCEAPCDRYVDCRELTCNALHLSCIACEQTSKGFCPSCIHLKQPVAV